MKLSELIAVLQKIDATVPFDSEIVTHGSIYTDGLINVRHEPPYTILEFESQLADE